MRLLLTVFLIGHAAVHAVMWTLPFTDATRDMPFNPGHSWLLGDNRVLAAVVAGVAAVAFAVTALGYLIDAGWWPPAMLAAAAVSLLLLVAWSRRGGWPGLRSARAWRCTRGRPSR